MRAIAETAPMEAFGATGPRAYAARLARYVSDPSRIRSLVAYDYGLARAPSVDECREFREKHLAEVRKFAEGAKGVNYEVANDTGEHFHVRGLVTAIVESPPPAPSPTLSMQPTGPLWPRWYNPFAIAEIGEKVRAGVAADFRMAVRDLCGPSREKRFVEPRAVVARLLQERGWSLARIGTTLGGRDHSTVLNLIEKFSIYADRNPQVLISYMRLRVMVGAKC